MNTEFGVKLQTAIDARNNDINNLVWKDNKNNEVRLMDMTHTELRRCYKHCNEMLHNNSAFSPGKYVIKTNIQKCWNNCNTELFVRYLFHELDTPIKTTKTLLEYINSMKNEEITINSPITAIFNNVPPIYETITLNDLMNKCFDKLDIINRRVISDKFIISQGIWLTAEEKKELTEKNEDGTLRDRREIIKEQLCLNDVHLRLNSNGFTFAEFRALVQMPDMPKISTLPTITLKTLRDKVLLMLDSYLDTQIMRWEELKQNIERVAEYKNWELN